MSAEATNLKLAIGEKPNVILKFLGTGRDVRLEEVTFCGYNGVLQSHRGKTTKAAIRVFRWGPGVRSMCLLLAKCARAATDPLASDFKLVGGERSPANSLDVAVAKSSELGWMSDMFGTSEDGETVAKLVFSKKNSYRKHKSQPVQVWVNADYLPYENIKILRDGESLTASDLARLEEDIAADLMRSPIQENRPTVSLAGVSDRKNRQTFHDFYRDIWSGAKPREQKILRTRESLGTAMPRQYVILLYRFKIFVDATGMSEFRLDITVCNWGLQPVERTRHEFRFDESQPIPFTISIFGPDRLVLAIDGQHYKSFFVEFAEPLAPGETRRYEVTFQARSEFEDAYWDFQLGTTLINHILFEFVQETERQVVAAGVERISDTGKEVFEVPDPLLLNWDNGVAINVYLPFPEAGSLYRINWAFHPRKGDLSSLNVGK